MSKADAIFEGLDDKGSPSPNDLNDEPSMKEADIYSKLNMSSPSKNTTR